MVEVTIFRYRDGCPHGFSAAGHSVSRRRQPKFGWRNLIPLRLGWQRVLRANRVCAGVSALVLHTIGALQSRLGLDVHCRIRPGDTVCYLPEEMAPSEKKRAEFLLEAMADSLQQMQNEYQGDLRVNDKTQQG